MQLQTNGQSVHLIVSNTGVGIPEADQKNIFNRFYRSEKHRPTNAGSGLGLTIVKQIIDLHNGNITLDSQMENRTTFKISLPV